MIHLYHLLQKFRENHGEWNKKNVKAGRRGGILWNAISCICQDLGIHEITEAMVIYKRSSQPDQSTFQ